MEENAFDELCERAMACVARKEWRSALEVFKQALEVDRKEEGGDISEERADVAYNMACCAAQLGDLDEAEVWLRRAVSWGVRGVRPEVDEDLEPLRTSSVERLNRFLTAIEPLTSSGESAVPAAVLGRTKRSNAGRGMNALAREMAEEGAWDDEDDEGFEEEAGDERDVFDSDFDESEDDDDDEAAPKKPAAAAQKKKQPSSSSKRAAAHKAQAINSVAVNATDADDDDDEDGDFEDDAADAELGAPLEPRQSAMAAASEAVRKRKAQEAWRDLDGDEPEPAPREDAPKKKKKRRLVYAAAPTKKSALSVLGGIFGHDAAVKIIARAKANRAKRDVEPSNKKTPVLLRRQTVVETKTFAGEKIEIKRTVMADANAAKEAQPATGIDAVIAELKAPQNITTVAKSSSDWDAFKSKEGLEDSLRDASKKGILVNQEFLERCDHRAFDREKDERDRLRAFRDAQLPTAP